jgi:hypothetical protein
MTMQNQAGRVAVLYAAMPETKSQKSAASALPYWYSVPLQQMSTYLLYAAILLCGWRCLTSTPVSCGFVGITPITRCSPGLQAGLQRACTSENPHVIRHLTHPFDHAGSRGEPVGRFYYVGSGLTRAASHVGSLQ